MSPAATTAVRRLAWSLPLAWCVLTLTFLLVLAAPGDPFSLIEIGRGGGSGSAAPLRAIFETGEPLLARYVRWLAAFARGDLGLSISMRRPVADLIVEALSGTFLLAGIALLLQFAIGTAAGAVAARRAGSLLDRVVVALASWTYATPSFWMGIFLVWLLAVQAGWLPVSQMRSIDAADLGPAGRALDLLEHLVLPCAALALPTAGGIALYVREEMVAALRSAPARAARGRGITARRVVWAHALRSALPSIVTLLGLALPALAGGSVVVESLFGWPGAGRLLYQAVLARDLPLVLGCAWAGMLLVIFGGLVADLVVMAVDPRVSERAA